MKQLISKQCETRGRQSGPSGQKWRPRLSAGDPAVSCVAVRDGGHGVYAAVRRRSAGLHGRHAHADQTEGKRTYVCPCLRLTKHTAAFRELSRPVGNWQLPGEAAIECARYLGSQKNWVPPGLRGKGERNGYLHSISYVHSFTFAIYSVFTMPLWRCYLHFTNVDTEAQGGVVICSRSHHW